MVMTRVGQDALPVTTPYRHDRGSNHYRDLMDGDTNVGEAGGKLAELSGDVPFLNSFFYGLEGR